MADSVVIVDGGRLVATGHPGELSRALPSRRSASALRPGSTWRSGRPPLRRAGDGGGAWEYLVGCRPELSVVAELTAWLASHDIPLADLRAGRHRLEDIHLALTSRAGPAPPPPEVVGQFAPARPVVLMSSGAGLLAARHGSR